MRYWDASALVPLLVAEPSSGLVREWLAEDDGIITWVWSHTEIVSAIDVEREKDHCCVLNTAKCLGVLTRSPVIGTK